MTKKILIAVMILCFSLSLPVWAKGKGASEKAFQKANENAVFKKDPDWFNKIGKGSENNVEKEQKAAQKEARKAKKQAKKEAKKVEAAAQNVVTPVQ